MIRTLSQGHIEPVHMSATYDSVDRMLHCLLGNSVKNCKICTDCDACTFLTQAVFTIAQKKHQLSGLS